MNIFRWLKNQIDKFIDSIDTITTKLLILVLCCISIPLFAVATFSTDVINQSIIDNVELRLDFNKRIFERKYFDEQQLLGKSVNDSIQKFMELTKKPSALQSENFINYLFKNNSDLSFAIALDSSRNIKAFKGRINPEEFLNKFSKLIKISYAEDYLLSTENLQNDIFHITINPIFINNNISSIIIAGKSLKNSDILSHVNKITDVKIAIYNINDKKANIIAVSDNNYVLSNIIEVKNTHPSNKIFYLNKNDLSNLRDFHLNFPLINFFNQPIGSVYLGISKYDFIIWINKNVKLISFIAIISMIVAIIIAALFARKITDPILELKEAAESINLGDLNYKVAIKGNDETVKLSKAFNKMVNNLERDEQLRNNFVATLTHDLKVPMLAENQTVSFLLKETYGPLTKEQREVLELIKSTNNSSLEMIGTLLEIYRYDCGNAQLFISEFDLLELAKESLNQIKSLAEDKKIKININSLQEKIMIKGDKRDIKRLMHNLVSNSINHGIHRGFLNCSIEIINDTIKYLPKTDTEYYTSLKNPINISNCILVSIEDNGLGINREDIPLLFNRFSLNKGRKPAGSGLGLYYASQVVKLHQGRIWVESSDTGGSSFKFTLPLTPLS